MPTSPTRVVVGTAAALIATVLVSSPGGAADDPTATASEPAVASAAAGASAKATVSARLQRLATASTDPSVRASAGDRAARSGLPASGTGGFQFDPDGRVIVEVAISDASTATDSAIRDLGARIIATGGGGALATIAVPVGSLDDLGDLAAVDSVIEVLAPVRSGVGAPARPIGAAACSSRTVSEGDAGLRADQARAQFMVDGTDVSIGVLSDSFDALGGAPADVADGELPGPGNPCGRTVPVVIQSDSFDPDVIDEGRAMAQIVHDLAPGAEIVMATAFVSELDFADQVERLGERGVDVTTDDIAYLREPMFQDGPVAAAIRRNRLEHGIVHYTAAGNSNVIIDGRDVASYEAPAFRPTPCGIAVLDADYECHDFDPGPAVEVGNTLTVQGGGELVLSLGWSEPMFGVRTDLDAFLIDRATGEVVDSSLADNSLSNRPAEVVGFSDETGSTRDIDLVIGRFRQGRELGTPRLKHVVVRESGLVGVGRDRSVGGDVVGPTIFGHSSSTTANSVGAVPFNSLADVETFSSRGPGAVCWEAVDGDAVQPAIEPCEVTNVDIVATDGTANSFFGGSFGSTFRFFGTSAAAPHAAAVAALALEHIRCVDEVEAKLRSTAIDLPGFDVDAEGDGRIDAVATLQAMDPACTIPTIEPVGALLVGRDEERVVPLSVDDQDDGAAALSVTAESSNSTLLPNSGVDVGGAGRERTLTITPIAGQVGTTTITVTVRDPSGQTATEEVEVTVQFLDGDDDGIADHLDNCPADPNPLQDDGDADGVGDLCDPTNDRTVFVSLDPARFADSRTEPTFDGRFRATGPRQGGTTWEIEVAGRGDVLSSSLAVIANVTVLNGVAPGFATVFPCGDRPNASSVNYGVGGVEANEVIARLSTSGTLCIFTSASADVIVDVVGFVPPDTAFTPLVPARFADSRDEPTIDGRARNTGRRRGGSVWEIDIAGRGSVPDFADTVIANVTVVDGDGPGFATVFPCGALSAASSLNYAQGDVRPNEVVAQLSPLGALCVFTSSTADIIVDVVGYIEPTSGYRAVAPRRYADSRDEPTFDGAFQNTGPRRGGTSFEIEVAGRGIVPAGADTVVANVTVTGTTAPGFALVFPCGDLPGSSSVNFGVGDTRPNEVVARLSDRGTLCVFASATADVLVDVVGFG